MNVKPFWQSVSFWMTILAIVGMALDKLVLDGVIPNEGWIATAILVIGLVTKRGLTENTAIKANALVAAKGEDPPANP